MEEDLTCEYCLEIFKNKLLLKKHIKNAQYCIKYRNIKFTCLNCNFSTIGIKNIEKHKIECINDNENKEDFINNENEIKVVDQSQEQDNNNDDNLSYEFDGSLYDLKEKNIDLEILLRIETKLDNLLEINNKKKKKYDVNKTICTNVINDLKNLTNVENSNNNKEENIILNNKINIKNNDAKVSVKKSPEVKNFRSLGKVIELKEEPSEDIINTKIIAIENKINEIKNMYKEKIINSEIVFEECFKSILKNKTYVKELSLIKTTRLKLIEMVSQEDYIKLLQKHVTKLENICKEKHYSDKKTSNIITKTLNTLDTRLISYVNYHNIPLEMDEIQKFKNSLFFYHYSPPHYVTFKPEKIFESFFNLGCGISTIKENIERYLFNKYGFNNIIYVPIKSSTDDDPFSFYILDRVDKKRYWKMDCRLEQLIITFIDNIKPYLIKLFRKFYYDVFNDNDYRSNYVNLSPITENECQQILQNIYVINNFKEFSLLLRNIVKNNSTYFPTENDKFNMYSNDMVQKKRFNIKEPVDNTEVLKLLFDNMTNEQAVDCYRNS
jgi:hypothetical protein